MAQNHRATGAQEVVRFLSDSGCKHVFGLPGSSTVPLLYELAGSDIRSVPTVHESVAVAAADGYARVAGSAFAYLYMLPGTANGLGNLYNAWRDESSVLLLVSQQASTLRTREGTIGETDLIPLVQPFSRHARELSAGMPVYHHLAAGFRAATGYPGGPAVVALPEDVLEEEAPVQAVPATTRVAAGAPDVSEIARRLAGAKRPLLVVGGQVRRYDGSELLENLAQDHRIAVAAEPGFLDRLSIAPSHGSFVGSLLGVRGSIAEQNADFVAVVGGRFIAEGHPRKGPYFPNAEFVVHVNVDPAKLEETRVANWSCACDPAAFIRALSESLPASLEQELDVARSQFIDQCLAAKLPDGLPFAKTLASYNEAVAPLGEALRHGWVVDEAVMGSVAMINALSGRDGRRYVGTTGGSLGWGTGASVGVALASGEPVTCVLGDGALRFGAQGLWTAVAEKLPITYVILDNSGYGSTRFFSRAYADQLGTRQGDASPAYIGMDFRDTGSDVAGILRGFGVRCPEPVSCSDAQSMIEKAWAGCQDGPNAVVVKIPYEAD